MAVDKISLYLIAGFHKNERICLRFEFLALKNLSMSALILYRSLSDFYSGFFNGTIADAVYDEL